MNIDRRNGLKGCTCPSGLKSPGTHVIAAGYHRGGKQERIFKRNAAQIAAKPVLIVRKRCFTLRFYLIIQTVDQVTNRNISGPDTDPFTFLAAHQAGILLRQLSGSGLFIPEPDAAQKLSGIHMRTRPAAGRILAKDAVNHIKAGDRRFVFYHLYLSLPGLPQFFRTIFL